MPHDLGDEVSGIDVDSGDIDVQHRADPEGGRSDRHPVRQEAVGVVARRRNGEAHRPRTNTITGSVAVGVQPESVMLTPSERTLVVSLRGSPATLAFVDTVNLSLLGTVQIGGVGTFGDLA